MPKKIHIIKIRWVDGFCRELRCLDYQFGKDNYWIRLENGKEKWIPRENVRSVTVETVIEEKEIVANEN